jgi:hypothetical protein
VKQNKPPPVAVDDSGSYYKVDQVLEICKNYGVKSVSMLWKGYSEDEAT